MSKFPSLFQIHRIFLLAIYGIVPLSLLFILGDLFFFKQEFKHILTYSPENILTFSLFFNLPHILASFISFCDREYLSFYRNQLLFPIPGLLILAFSMTALLGYKFFTGFVYLWTACHFVGQQFGLTRLMTSVKSFDFFLWKQTGTACAILLYFGVYATDFYEVETRSQIEITVLLLLIPLLYCTTKMSLYAETKIGLAFIWCNFAMIGAGGLFYILGYPFFVILASRILHDVTAFYFYCAHDHNRNIYEMKNILYRSLQFFKLPIFFLCPLIAIGLAAPLTCFQEIRWVDFTISILSMIHYYTDGFTWKQSSLHRKALTLEN